MNNRIPEDKSHRLRYQGYYGQGKPRKTLRRSGFLSAFISKMTPERKKKIVTFSLGALAIFGVLGFGFVLWAAKDLPNPNKIIDRSVALSTKIYDRSGETLLYDIHGEEKRTFVNIGDVPKHLINATLTAEDRNFYEHRGISVTGIIRSVLKNLTTGSRVGGSTLTQQLVKNAVLTSEKTYTRKLKEVILSYQIERRFSKEEILQMYFNEIPYGSVAYGAEAASQTYFGKSVKDISLAEAAILAAMVQRPSYYSPYGSHTDALFARQHWILDSMAELGYISKEEAEAAKTTEVQFKEIKQDILAPHFVMYIKEYLTEKYGEATVEQGGLKIITTLDMHKQKIAEEAVAEQAEKNLSYGATNASLVALDPKTGQIVAMVGSVDYFNDEIDGQVNVSIRPRQPGSSFKPIVYAAALDKGYTPDTVVYDVVTNFVNYDGQTYTPHNYSLNENGPVTFRKALAGSLNIPAVKAIYLTGVDRVLDFAEGLGYTTLTDRGRFGLALVLGGGEVKLLEHTAAFAAFAREGEYHPPVGILEVQDKDGSVLEKYESKEKKVVSTQVARQMNDILSDNNARAYVFGANNRLNLGARPVAAKTGTTNDYHDAWTMGYTPSLAAGVWVGNSDNTEMKRGADGSIIAAPIWHSFMSRVLGDTPVEQFNKPDPVETNKAMLNGATSGETVARIDSITGKLATEHTPAELVEEKTFRDVHTILHYLHKDDPRGDTPPDRESQQYKNWEEAVQRWASAQEIVSEKPPTEFDDVHTPENQPTIQITSPQQNHQFNSRDLRASVNVSAPRGISKVEYYLDETLIETTTAYPFNLNTTVNNAAISAGRYTLRAVAYDDVLNRSSDGVEVVLDISALPSSLEWSSPQPNETIPSSAFPYTISGRLTNPGNINQVTLYYQKDGQRTYLNSSRQFNGNTVEIRWTSPPSPGNYQLLAEISNKDGNTYKSNPLPITIGE